MQSNASQLRMEPSAAPSSRPLVISLEAISTQQLPEVGGKGASLGRMLQAALPVPPGFVVTAEVSRQHLLRPALSLMPRLSLGNMALLLCWGRSLPQRP